MQFLTTTTESYISLFFTLALMLVLLYFMIYRPQKKQEKKDAAMRAALEIGDQVVTIGGSCWPCGRHQGGHFCSGDRFRPCEDPLHQECDQLC